MTKAFDLFISETAVSNAHGVGITLQRILGNEVESIKRFIHFGPFAKAHPALPSIQRKCRYFYGPLDVDIIGPLMTGRLGGWCRDSRLERWLHSSLAAARTATMFPADRSLNALVCPQGIISILTLEALKRKRQVKYVTWFMDDHLLEHKSGKWGYPASIAEIMRRHLCEARAVVAISPVLASFYEQQFGVKPEVLFGPGDLDGDAGLLAPVPDGLVRIGYFGSVWQWQLDALIRFARALRPGKEVLHVFSLQSTLPKQLQIPTVKLQNPVPKEQISETMRNYDAVIIPVGFHESQRKYSEFNIATKMSECLASGTQTIVFGPTYSAMARYLQGSGAAHVLTDESLANWPEVARKLRDPDSRRQMLDSALELVHDELSTKAMKTKWRSISESL
jgi:hypothetical protein